MIPCFFFFYQYLLGSWLFDRSCKVGKVALFPALTKRAKISQIFLYISCIAIGISEFDHIGEAISSLAFKGVKNIYN